MSKTVSVIIPNYNHETFLKERIESVLNQTVDPLEIIILDDCSTDNSRSIIEAFAAESKLIRFIPNEKNSGSTFAQWNKGVSEAKGELIWIAESDDKAAPELIEKITAVMDSSTVLAYCQSYRMNANAEITGSWESHTDEFDEAIFKNDFIMDGQEYMERFLIHMNSIPNASAVIFRKELYEKTGGAPEYLKSTGDWLVWLKLLCFGNIAYVAAALNYFRYHESSVIAKALKENNEHSFRDWYGYDSRLEFISFLRSFRIKLSEKAEKINEYYVSVDKGNLGLHTLRSGNIIKGWRLILQASFSPKWQTGFIKKALFKKV